MHGTPAKPADDLTAMVKSLAERAGFARVGIAPVDISARGRALRQWLAAGLHAGLSYMARNVEKRLRPDLLVPGARSVICLAVSYAPDRPIAPGQAVVARYARGRDYHRVLRRRCLDLMGRIREIEPDFQGRAFVDSAPVMERSLAAAAGIGWIGNNGCLVAPGLGSYVLLCEIFCNLPLSPDRPITSGCEDCRQCVRACPTGALVAHAVIDCRRCVSSLTVEQRGWIDASFWPLMGLRVFGCDACQEVCPVNRGVAAGDAELLGDGPALGGAGLADILRWRREDWDETTRASATRRASWEMFLRNAAIAAGNSGDPSLRGPLERLAITCPRLEPIVAWALDRLPRQ